MTEYKKILEGLKEKSQAEDKAVAPLIDESDLKIVAQAQAKLS